MNGQRIFFSDQNLNPNSIIEGTNSHFEYIFKNFLHNFTRQNSRLYQKRLEMQIRNRKYVLPIQISDLRSFDDNLFDKLTNSPLESLKIMEMSVGTYLKQRKQEFSGGINEEWQVVLRSDDNPIKIREIKSLMVSKIFVISGIIISTTKPFIKASNLKIICRTCETQKTISLEPGQMPYVPSYCEGNRQRQSTFSKCPKDSYIAMPTSQVIDAQYMRIQEYPDEVPTGQVARTYSLIVDRYNVGKCVPGDRARITGVMLVNDGKSNQVSKGYIYVTGIQKLKERSDITYTEQEEELFKQMSKDREIVNKVYQSIAPGIYGNEEIKKSIACMLFGGSRKHLPDGTVLRGDINVLLLGDPSTAKSQFLKFVEQAAHIAVYTSGKGSSAAGLTATITKDSTTGEFQIQGGALVLADGGIVCIDEFDKMKPGDRVAIHEAMQQQTISVAKAGITTRLNSRTSILAAANPIYGRLDDLKTVEEQIQLQNTILSRFDCIFIVKDINTPEANERIARHILDLHQGKSAKPVEGSIPFETMKKYIKYARNKIHPRLSLNASEKLQHIYVQDRKTAKVQREIRKGKSTIPITVRQLEAVIRLSESIARMKLKLEVGIEEVEEAHYLFSISTMKTIEGGKEFGYELTEGMSDEIQKAEEAIKKRVCIGNQVAMAKLMEDLEQSRYSHSLIVRALSNLIRFGDFREIKGRKLIVRER